MKLKLREYWKKNPKKRKLIMFVSIAIGMTISFGLYALAQSLIDSFSDASRVASTWDAQVDTGAGEVKLAAKTCDDGVWFCSANNICPNSLGDGTYIVVNRVDEATIKQWKLSNTACSKPNCGTDGGQDGDNLVADNTVNFSSYPARDACKAVGGRMPTKSELQCIYTNRATFGDNFSASGYWSLTEYSPSYAWGINFVGGSAYNTAKVTSYHLRCVRGW